MDVMPSFGYYPNYTFTSFNWAHIIPKCGGLLTKLLDLRSYYSLGNRVYCYGIGKRCYYLTGYALLITIGLSLLFSGSMFLLAES
jgi:hypothetical protein